MRRLLILWAGLATGCTAAGSASRSSSVEPFPCGGVRTISIKTGLLEQLPTRESSVAGSVEPEEETPCPLPEKAKLVVRDSVVAAGESWSLLVRESADGILDLQEALFGCRDLESREYVLELPDDLAVARTEALLQVIPVSAAQKAALVVDGSEIAFRRGLQEPMVGRWVRIIAADGEIEAFEVRRNLRAETHPTVVARQTLTDADAIAPWIERTCASGTGCSGAIVDITGDFSSALLKKMFKAINTSDRKAPPIFTVRTPRMGEERTLLDPNELPVFTARLPPAVIERFVGKLFRAFGDCYMDGLSRNANLAGRVSIRFVIERDGTVAKSENADSDLPDPQVIGCVAEAFKSLVFPNPERNTVTVIYPIMLTSD